MSLIIPIAVGSASHAIVDVLSWYSLIVVFIFGKISLTTFASFLDHLAHLLTVINSESTVEFPRAHCLKDFQVIVSPLYLMM